MSVRIFLDTNIIVYAVDMTRGAAHKRDQARKILRDEDFCISAQVLQEFFVCATTKLKRPLTIPTAARWVEQLCRVQSIAIDSSLVKVAIAHSKRYQIAYWDGAIIAAAEALGATTLFSEDMSHGQTYGTVEVVNPFR